MLASQPCLHAFWVLTSLHLLSFLLKMFFIIFDISVSFVYKRIGPDNVVISGETDGTLITSSVGVEMLDSTCVHQLIVIL